MKKRIFCILTACVMLMSVIMLAVPVSAEESKEPFKALEAIRYSDTQIAVVFNEEIAESTLTNFKGYKGIRYVWDRKDGTYGGYIGNKSGETTYEFTEYSAKSVAFYQQNDTTYETILVYTFESKETLDAVLSEENVNRSRTSSTGCNAVPAWYVQEIEKTTVTVDGTATSSNYNSDIGHLYNFASKSGKLLTATRSGFCNEKKDDNGTLTGYSTDWDDCVLPITTNYSWTPSADEDVTTTAPVNPDPSDDTTTAPVDPDLSDSDNNPDAPNTADNSILFTGIAAVSVAVGVALVLILRKKKTV